MQFAQIGFDLILNYYKASIIYEWKFFYAITLINEIQIYLMIANFYTSILV